MTSHYCLNNNEMSFYDLDLLHRQFYSKDKITLTPRKLGNINLSLLISQGLSLLFVSKKNKLKGVQYF